MKKFLKNKKTLILLSVLIVAVFGLLIGLFVFNNNEETEKKQETEKQTSAKEIQIVDINSTTRPYAVMIENSSTARPYHAGLQDAYILYEIVVEGGISRYLGLFKDVDTERISGVRSARHYYLDYAIENDAYYIHWGASTPARNDLNYMDIDSYEVYNNKYAFYDTSLPVSSENSTYTSMAELKSAIATTGYRSELNKDLLLNYTAEELDESKLEGAISANEVKINYSNSNIPSFSYNTETKTYNHFINSAPHNDYITGNQYNFKNIITYQVYNYDMPNEIKGRQELNNVGSGTGYYISEGYAIPINWSKESRESQTIYTYTDGTELIVNDGNTYISIQPQDQPLVIE